MRPVSVFVGGLGDDVDKDDLEREFGKYGQLSKVWVAQNPPGFAFIEFETMEDANEAIDAMNGAVINNSRIRVELSRNSSRRGRGGFRGRGSRDGGFRDDRSGGFQDRGDSYGRRDAPYESAGRYGGYASSRYGSPAGGQYSSYGSSAQSYGGMGDSYRSSAYRSRSPVDSRNSSYW